MMDSRKLLPASLVLLLLPAAASALDQPAPVRIAYVKAGEAPSQISLTGTVVAARRALVASELAGIVDSLSVRVGDRVARGAPLARLRQRPLELALAGARGELAEATAEQSSTALRLERLQELSGSEVVSRQNVDDAGFDLQAAEARVARLEAEVDRLVDQLARSTVRSPFAGVVSAEHTQIGQWLEAGDAVIELVSLDGLEARLDVPESHYPAVRPGLRVSLRLGGAGPSLEAEIRAVVPAARERARTFPAYVPLGRRSVGVGATVEATVHLEAERGGVWVPQDAIVRRGDGDVVFRLASGSVVQAVSVEASGDGLWRVVQGGLSAGDAVVTEGNESLEDGFRVAAQEGREYPWP